MSNNNITRIKNNQVTDNTIEYQKLKDGTLVGSKFNPNLTLNSNVTILGNLTVANSFAQLNSINTYINDPLVVFNNNYTGSPTYDIGILVNRNLSSLAPYGAVNAAFVWKEADNAFEALMTTETGTTAGSINNSGWANVKLGNLTAITATVTGALTAGTASFASINNTPIGNATPAIGSFTYLTAVNGFQTGNAVINGGYISTLTNATITTATLTNTTATNFYSGNIYVSGGYINNLANIAASTGYITNLNSTNGNVTTLVATNFSTANAQVTGGTIIGLTNLTATTAQATNFSSGNAVITGGSATGLTNLSATTAVATNFSSGNAVITGGSITGDSSGTFTTLQGSNFSSGNAVITGAQTYIGTGAQLIANAYVTTGYFTNLSAANLSITTENVTTLNATNFSTANAVISGGYISAVANIGAVYGTFTNLASGNAQITGGSLLGITNLSSTTSVATNFSSGNAVISGGSLNNSPVGNATPNTGAFTTLTSNGLTTFTNATESTSTSIGAVVVTGGVGIGKNLNVGGNAIISGNLTVNGTFEYINSTITTHEDPILELNTGPNGVALTGTAFDSGIRTHYWDGATDRSAFFGRTNDSANFEYYGYVSSETGNVITGTYGTIKSGALLLANTTAATSSATGALQVSGGAGISGDLYAYRLNGTYGNITTGYFGSLNTANAVITGGYITGVANIGTTYLTTTNLYTANAVITGGYATGLANATATYGTFTNLNSSNVLISGGSISGLTNLASGTSVATNFSSGNAVITGGYATGLANATATYGTFTNLSTANAVLAGGSINNMVIGNTTPAAATFTQLNTTNVSYLGGNIVANSNTASTSTTTGAIVIPGTGGIGIGGNINAGVFNTSLHHIQGNILLGQGSVQDSADSILTINLNTATPIVSNATVHISGAENKTTAIGIDTIGTADVASTVLLRRARGTATSPSAVQKTDVLGAFNARGYATTGFVGGVPTSGLNIIADENFTDTSTGTYLLLTAIPSGSTLGQVGLLIGGNGQVRVPGTISSTDPSTGALFVAGGAGISGNVNIGGKLLVTNTSLYLGTAKFASNLVANSSADSSSISTGALVVVGGAGIYSNVNIGGATTFNTNAAAGFDTIVRGATDSSLLWARAGTAYDQVLIGGSGTASTLVRGAKLQINSTDSLLIPAGTNAQRPGNSGGTDTAGMLRFNTTANGMEIYTGTSWQSFSTSFTVIADTQFNGDGTTTAFTLGSAQTTASCIVSINGVVQIPTLAYAVTGGTTLTFTEAPAAGDVIDVRMLTTTATVTSLASVNGYNSFTVDNYGANIYVGSSSTALAVSWEPGGAQVSYIANVAVASANTATTIDSFDVTKYRSAKYVVQVTNGTNYQVSEVLVIHDGTTATRAMYSTINTNANVGVTSATLSGGNVVLQYIAANSGAVVRVKKDYVAI